MSSASVVAPTMDKPNSARPVFACFDETSTTSALRPRTNIARFSATGAIRKIAAAAQQTTVAT